MTSLRPLQKKKAPKRIFVSLSNCFLFSWASQQVDDFFLLLLLLLPRIITNNNNNNDNIRPRVLFVLFGSLFSSARHWWNSSAATSFSLFPSLSLCLCLSFFHLIIGNESIFNRKHRNGMRIVGIEAVRWPPLKYQLIQFGFNWIMQLEFNPSDGN